LSDHFSITNINHVHARTTSVDVCLARTAQKGTLEPIIYEMFVERLDIIIREVAIVSIRNESVEIKPPGPDAPHKVLRTGELSK